MGCAGAVSISGALLSFLLGLSWPSTDMRAARPLLPSPGNPRPEVSLAHPLECGGIYFELLIKILSIDPIVNLPAERTTIEQILHIVF
jgi:hypothetical protein